MGRSQLSFFEWAGEKIEEDEEKILRENYSRFFFSF